MRIDQIPLVIGVFGLVVLVYVTTQMERRARLSPPLPLSRRLRGWLIESVIVIALSLFFQFGR